MDRAVAILRQNRQNLDDAARELLAHETLGEGRLRTIMSGLKRDLTEFLPVAASQPSAAIRRL